MTILKSYDENGKEIGSSDISLTEDNFQQYIDQYGLDRAMGYRDAVNDLMQDLFKPKPNEILTLTAQKTMTLAKTFKADKIALLKKIVENLDAYLNNNASTTNQKYKS